MAWGLCLQLVFAFIVLKFQWGQFVMQTWPVRRSTDCLLSYAQVGASFIFEPWPLRADRRGWFSRFMFCQQ